MGAAVANELPEGVPFPQVPYEQATWPSAARKVWACLRFFLYRLGAKDGRLNIPDKLGAQWCSVTFEGLRYGSTGIRCFQLGLEQLEALGAIERELKYGRRTIVVLIKFKERKKKEKTPRKAAAGGPAPVFPPAPPEPEPDPGPPVEPGTFAATLASLCRQAAEAIPAPAPSAAEARRPATIPIKSIKGVDPEDLRYLELKEQLGELSESERTRLAAARGQTAP